MPDNEPVETKVAEQVTAQPTPAAAEEKINEKAEQPAEQQKPAEAEKPADEAEKSEPTARKAPVRKAPAAARPRRARAEAAVQETGIPGISLADRNDSAEGQVEKRISDIISASEAAVAKSIRAIEQHGRTTPAQRNRREPSDRTPMRVRSARGTESRLPPARRGRGNRWFADESVPVVESERRFQQSDRSWAFFSKPCYFQSDAAQQFFERNYQSINATLLTITRVIGDLRNEALERTFMEQVNTTISAFEEELSEKGIRVLDAEMEKRNIPEMFRIARYDHQRKYTPAMHTPEVVRFIQIVTLFDLLVSRIDALRFNKLITLNQRTSMVTHWSGRIVRFADQLRGLRNAAHEEARKRGHKQRATEIAQRSEEEAAKRGLNAVDIPNKDAPAEGKQAEAAPAAETAPAAEAAK